MIGTQVTYETPTLSLDIKLLDTPIRVYEVSLHDHQPCGPLTLSWIYKQYGVIQKRKLKSGITKSR